MTIAGRKITSIPRSPFRKIMSPGGNPLLELPHFPKKEIARCFRWFGFHVFKKHSLIKAIGYKMIYSKQGEFYLNLSRRFRKVLRKVLKGF